MEFAAVGKPKRFEIRSLPDQPEAAGGHDW
jgi:hypothetical protein